MPRAFNDEERARIRAGLIEAGKKLINCRGVRLLSVDDAAREAGISKGSFYSFFPSREDFILSVLEAWEAEHRGRLLADLAAGEGELRERLERFFLAAFEILEREPGLAKLGFKDIEPVIARLPAERIAAHKANDERVLAEAFASWAKRDAVGAETMGSLGGLGMAVFMLAIHREDFPAGSYGQVTRILARALARELSEGASLPPEGKDA